MSTNTTILVVEDHQITRVDIAVKEAVEHYALKPRSQPLDEGTLGVDASVFDRLSVVYTGAVEPLHDEHPPRGQIPLGYWRADVTFTFGGALVAVGTLYTMLNSLEVSRGANGIKTVRRILGIAVKRSYMNSHEFVMFKKDSRFQTQGAGKHVMYYSV